MMAVASSLLLKPIRVPCAAAAQNFARLDSGHRTDELALYKGL